MTVIAMDNTGFTIETWSKDDDQLVGRASFTWAEVGLPEEAGPMARWAVGNGFSQAFTDSGAGKPLAKRVESFAKKLARFRAGVVPSFGGTRGPAVDELEREIRDIVAKSLNKAGMTKTDAAEKAKNWQSVAEEVGRAIAESKNEPDMWTLYRDELVEGWTAKAQRRLDDAGGLPIKGISL